MGKGTSKAGGTGANMRSYNMGQAIRDIGFVARAENFYDESEARKDGKTIRENTQIGDQLVGTKGKEQTVYQKTGKDKFEEVTLDTMKGITFNSEQMARVIHDGIKVSGLEWKYKAKK